MNYQDILLSEGFSDEDGDYHGFDNQDDNEYEEDEEDDMIPIVMNINNIII